MVEGLGPEELRGFLRRLAFLVQAVGLFAVYGYPELNCLCPLWERLHEYCCDFARAIEALEARIREAERHARQQRRVALLTARRRLWRGARRPAAKSASFADSCDRAD